MGIVVCVVMLLGLVMLRPSPWNGAHRVRFNPVFQTAVWILLAVLGLWNAAYGLFKIDGFWCFMSLVSGVAMMLAAIMIFTDNETGDSVRNELFVRSQTQNIIILTLALSFLVYAITLIQLNLGFAILR